MSDLHYQRYKIRTLKDARDFKFRSFIFIAIIYFCFSFVWLSVAQSNQGLLEPYPLADGNINHHYKNVLFDRNKILIVRFGKGAYHNPTSIALYALHHYTNYYLTGSKTSLDEFMRHANWLQKNQKVMPGSNGVWVYDFPYARYKAETGWVSSIAQGYGISVMLEAWKFTGDDRFLRSAKLALNSFMIPTSKGGVRSSWPDGSVWYEEYPTLPNSHVLNGFIFTLAGINDYYKMTGDKAAKKLFTDGIESLRKNLRKFDNGFTSLYDNCNNLAPSGYHTLHVRQLLWLYHVTGDEVFYRYAKGWLRYDIGFIKNASEDSEAISDYGSRMADLTSVPQSRPPKVSKRDLGYLTDLDRDYGYWTSSKMPADVYLDLGKKVTRIQNIIFYATSKDTMPSGLSVSTSDNGIDWVEALTINNKPPEITGQNKTKTTATFIGGYRIIKRPDGRFVRVTFTGTQQAKPIMLRAIDIHYDQSGYLNYLYHGLKRYFGTVESTPTAGEMTQ